MGQRFRAPLLWSEDAEHLFDWVLEAWAEKWTQRASVLQGISLKKRDRERKREKEREKEWHGEAKLWWSQVCSFFFKGSFYALSHTFPDMKDTKSCRVSSTLEQFDLHWHQDVFCIPFHLQGSLCYVHYLLAQRPINILWLFLDKGLSTRKPAFPLSFRSAVPLRKQSYILMEQRCSVLQQRKNILTQGSYVVHSKATACFSCIPTILANALPGAHWVKTRKLSNKHCLNIAVLFNKAFLALEGYAWGVVNNHVH